MGCCYSLFCKDENSSQNGEPNERTHLLVDPVTSNQNIQNINGDERLVGNSNALPKKTDEVSALNRILQETATNVIDVAALDSHNLQQHEYLERIKGYNMKVQHLFTTNKNKLISKSRGRIIQDVPNAEKVLSANLLGIDDINLITSSVSAALSAVNDIKVEHKEDLVVPFGLGLNY